MNFNNNNEHYLSMDDPTLGMFSFLPDPDQVPNNGPQLGQQRCASNQAIGKDKS
jgi:hypothetical protein